MKISHHAYILFLIVMAVLSPALNGQPRQLTGIVTSSEDNLPIPGVTVVVPKTAAGTITNADGEYSLSVPEEADTLEFRFVGMITRKIPIGNNTVIDVVLEPELYTVDEVVVTALGISRESKSLGYSVTAVDSKELTEGNNRSVLNALQGKVAGVSITSASGAPGSSTRILVRGVSSLTGSNQPLFVIDGVPVSNSQSGSSSINGGVDFGNKVNDINPDDIESVSILKGASGTVQYGSRAANGVIMITTKKGSKTSKSQISINSSVLFEQPLRLVKYQNDYGQGIYGDAVLYENMSWGPAFDNRFRPWGHSVDNSVRVKAYSALPDNVKDFFETGVSINNSISFSSGNEQTSYYLSYSNIQWDGIFPTNSDSYNKHTLALRSSSKITDRLSLSNSFNYVKKINSYVPTGQGEQSVYNQVMQTPRDISLRELADQHIQFNHLDNHYSLYTVNPYFILENNGNKNNDDRIFGSIDLDYQLAKGLALKWRMGGDVSNEKRKTWREQVVPGGNNENSSVFDPGSVGESSFYQMQLNSDLLFTYTKKLNNWDLNLLAGQSFNQRTARVLGVGASYLSIKGFPHLSNASEQPAASEVSSLRRSMGVFGSADFAYKNYLFFAFSMRNEWSSTLPLDKNSYFFPGTNIGLIFTELMPSVQKVLSYGKVRASWARVGNDAAPYQIKAVFTQGFHSDGFGYLSYPLTNNVNSYDVGDLLENNELKPETTDEFEVGADLRFYKNRFSVDFAYYNKSTTNLIWPAPLAYSSGYSRQIQNLGKITNNGIEALVTVFPVRNSRFEWEFSVNFTRNMNKLAYLNDELEEAELNALRIDGGQQLSWVAMPGQPIGVFKGRGPKLTEEGRIVVDNQGLPIAGDDLIEYGNSQYKYYGGIGNRFNHRNITLSFRFDFRKGGLMYSRTKDITLWAGTVPATLYNDRKPFIIPNSVVELESDENGEPVYIENTTPINATTLVNYWANGGIGIDGSSLIDKSFIKLREVVLSYSVPQNTMDKLPLENINISLVAKNLFLITPASQAYIDPELTTFGNDLQADFGEYGAQPSTRSYSVNLRLVF